MFQLKTKRKKEAEDYLAEANSEKRFRNLIFLIFFVLLFTSIAVAGVFLDYW